MRRVSDALFQLPSHHIEIPVEIAAPFDGYLLGCSMTESPSIKHKVCQRQNRRHEGGKQVRIILSILDSGKED